VCDGAGGLLGFCSAMPVVLPPVLCFEVIIPNRALSLCVISKGNHFTILIFSVV
jgi:hypothetical protein